MNGELEVRFREIWKDHLWKCEETVSGGGSTLAFTENIRFWLPRILAELGGK